MLRGPMLLRQIVASYLSSTYPGMVATARQQWNVIDEMLPLPLKYDGYDPMMADQYPSIGLFVISDSDHLRLDYGPTMGEEFRIRYSARIYVAVKSPVDENGVFIEPVYDKTIAVRDDMTTVLKNCLLARPSLGAPDGCLLDEASVNTEYPDLVRTREASKIWIASGVITAEITLDESLYRTAIGTAETIEILSGHL